jgi:hypothetical protein
MKFISRNLNYRYTIKHAMPAEPLTGRSAEPGIHVRFVNGIATINDESVIEALMKSDKYGSDFISGEDVNVTNKATFTEGNMEPEHEVGEVKYGYVEKTHNPKPAVLLDKDRQKSLDRMIEEKATEIAMKMAPEMAKKILESMAQQSSEKKVSEASKKMGRPKKKQTEEESAEIVNEDKE